MRRPSRGLLASSEETRAAITATTTNAPGDRVSVVHDLVALIQVGTQDRRASARRLGYYGLAVGATALAYYAAARAGLELAYLHGAVTALWPPVGVGLAILLLFGVRLWPGILIGDLFAGDFSTPLGTVLGQTAGNTLEVVAAALLVARLARGRQLTFERVGDVAVLAAAGAAGTAISAVVGTLSLRAGNVIGNDEVREVLRTWFLSDLSGVIVVTPAILTWALSRPARISRLAAVEATGLVVLLVALAELVDQSEVPYVVFPALIWAALRFGPIGAASATLLVSALTIWNTAHNAGPFVRSSITASLLSTQLFLAIAAVTSLVLAALTAERTRALWQLVQSEGAQRSLAHAQGALRRIATLVAAEARPETVFEEVTHEAAQLLGAPAAAIIRFTSGPAPVGEILGVWSERPVARMAVGDRLPLEGGSASVRVFETGQVQRVDDYERAAGPLAKTVRELGYTAAVAAPITLAGHLWGSLAVNTTAERPLPQDAGSRLCDFAELVGQAIDNADAHEKLAASRLRIVEAQDAERRRLERNLHDGAQQRLVSVALQLRLARAALGDDPQAAGLVDSAGEELRLALEELRELARGLHPAVLTERGLRPALEVLAMRAPFVVTVDGPPEGRLPAPIEAALYYVAAETLTNAAKHANASTLAIAVTRHDGVATMEIRDDGCGGASAREGGGLRGLADRVEALHGRLEVTSPPGSGTTVRAIVPCPPA